MSSRTFRIIVRGVFDGLSPEQRAELLADAEAHDVLTSAFTAEGHLTYEIQARDAFTFRFLETGDSDEEIVPAAGRAEAAAQAWLNDRGYGFKNLRSQAQDMSKAPLAKRQRREQSR